MPESAYLATVTSGHRMQHRYSDRVHILSDAWALSLLARLSHPDVHPPIFHTLLESCYRRLCTAVVEQLRHKIVASPTRMTEHHPDARFHGRVIDPNQATVLVDIARGGIVPTYVLQQELLQVLEPAVVRVDHVYMQRIADENGKVVGVETAGSKIGGPVAGATVIIPDPMGATGSSIVDTCRLYSELEGGPPNKMVTCHLIITPEYIRRVTDAFPDVHIYALRLDRGQSSEEALQHIPGTLTEQENGLNAIDYIVPGAGGLGEITNNAFV